MPRFRNLRFLGFPKHKVSTKGEILRRIANKWRVLKGSNYSGYKRVELRQGRSSLRISVHRLVLEAFIGPCPIGMEACHFPDKTKTNNSLENLRWGTSLENHMDSLTHGTRLLGENHPKSLITDTDVRIIRKLHKTGKYTLRELAAMFGLKSHRTVQMITTLITWRHVL